MTRFRLVQGAPVVGRFAQTIRLGPPRAPDAGCVCAVRGFAWASGGAIEAHVLGTEETLAAFVAGDLCGGTVSVSSEWSGAGSPVVAVDGAVVRVDPQSIEGEGILSIAAVLTCGSERIPAGSVRLVVTSASYSSGPNCFESITGAQITDFYGEVLGSNSLNVQLYDSSQGGCAPGEPKDAYISAIGWTPGCDCEVWFSNVGYSGDDLASWPTMTISQLADGTPAVWLSFDGCTDGVMFDGPGKSGVLSGIVYIHCGEQDLFVRNLSFFLSS